jgi:hypothetical protein
LFLPPYRRAAIISTAIEMISSPYGFTSEDD